MTSAALLFIRTPTGRITAFSPEANLSAKLKSMLKAVDGKTSVSALTGQFSDSDAADLLAQLELKGLIQLRRERDNGYPATAAGMSPLPALQALSIAETQNAVLPQSDNLLTTENLATLPIKELMPQTGLAVIVEVMCAFVLTYCPQHAFAILPRLEGFKTLAELRAELPDYALMANALGSAGLVHMAELTERVQEAAAAS